MTIQNNDIGPCGSETFQQWADGISLSCRNSIVRNNMIQGATDGGIVIFGSPGSQIYNNTIWVLNVCCVFTDSWFQELTSILKQTLLGGINMVDYDPWSGDFTGTVVRDNLILGGFATDTMDDNAKGNNFENAIIK
jgi:parallel beta-helix repeat protein